MTGTRQPERRNACYMSKLQYEETNERRYNLVLLLQILLSLLAHRMIDLVHQFVHVIPMTRICGM